MGPNDTPVPFQANKVGQWTSTLVENVLKELAEKNSEAAKNGQQKFKYVGMQTPPDAARKQTLMMRAPGHWQSGSGRARRGRSTQLGALVATLEPGSPRHRLCDAHRGWHGASPQRRTQV
jgi:hypothetical protein